MTGEELMRAYRGPITSCQKFTARGGPPDGSRIWDGADAGALVRIVTGCNAGHPQHEMRGFWHLSLSWRRRDGENRDVAETGCGLVFNPDETMSPERPPAATDRFCNRPGCEEPLRRLGYQPTDPRKVSAVMMRDVSTPGSWDQADWMTLRADATDMGVRFGCRLRDR